MSSLFGGGKSGETAEEAKARQLRDQREKEERKRLAQEQDLDEREKIASQRRGRGLAGQTLSSGFTGFSLFGDNQKKDTLGG